MPSGIEALIPDALARVGPTPLRSHQSDSTACQTLQWRAINLTTEAPIVSHFSAYEVGPVYTTKISLPACTGHIRPSNKTQHANLL